MFSTETCRLTIQHANPKLSLIIQMHYYTLCPGYGKLKYGFTHKHSDRLILVNYIRKVYLFILSWVPSIYLYTYILEDRVEKRSRDILITISRINYNNPDFGINWEVHNA